jgi:hypothetical protein
MKSQEFVFGLLSKHHIRARFKHVVPKFEHLKTNPHLLNFRFHACGKVCMNIIIVKVIFIIYKSVFFPYVASLRPVVM